MDEIRDKKVAGAKQRIADGTYDRNITIIDQASYGLLDDVLKGQEHVEEAPAFPRLAKPDSETDS